MVGIMICTLKKILVQLVFNDVMEKEWKNNFPRLFNIFKEYEKLMTFQPPQSICMGDGTSCLMFFTAYSHCQELYSRKNYITHNKF